MIMTSMPRFIDGLRGCYVHSPRWLRKAAGLALSAIPYNLKYGSTYRGIRAQIVQSEFDAEFVRAYQVEQLRLAIASCWKGSRFYRDRIEEGFGRPPVFSEMNVPDLVRLPVLTKDQVRKNTADLVVTDLSRVELATTSGSSGEPLQFYLDKDRSVKEWAFIHHLWNRIEYREDDRRAVLRGVHIKNADKRPWEYDSALRELRLSPFHLVPEVMDAYLDLLATYKIKFIHGYPSAISILATHAMRRSWIPPSTLIGILPVSEQLLPYQRDLIKKAFRNVRVMPFYGLSEKVAIAGEVVDEAGVYEYEPLYGLTELVDDHGVSVVRTGCRGRIVSTGFLSKGMPLLRYDTGDTAELVTLPAQSNCYRLRLRGIQSRWGQELVVGRNGALISMTAINIHSAAYTKIQTFQLYQDRPGEVAARVVPIPGASIDDILPFVKEIQEKVGSAITFHLELTPELPTNARGKRRFVDQKLNLQLPQEGGVIGKVL
jgi:phenylacetate-CoA ligase